jgi:membrane protease YdiL (CAAX protease family)
MFMIQNKSSNLSRSWQRKAWIQLLAVAIGVIPLYSSLIILQLCRDEPFTIQAFIFYLAVISPSGIVIALLVLRYLCRENPRALNLRPGKLSSDLLAVLILSVIIIVVNVISTFVLSALIPASPANTDITNLFVDLASNPWLLVLFLGLLLLLGAASEEIVRVFLLSRLWKVWPSTMGKFIAVVISASLFGLIHLYQGPVSASWTVIFGLIMALYYLWFGRTVPLILAHYLTNAIQIIVFTVPGR